MSSLLKFEQNLETALTDHFNVNGLEAEGSRSLNNLGAKNVQVIFEYGGALDDSRQTSTNHTLGKQFQEFNLHTGQMRVQVVTYRSTQQEHYDRVAKVRELMLKYNNPFKGCAYQIYEIKPLSTNSMEDEESNADLSDINYEIHFRVDLAELEVDD